MRIAVSADWHIDAQNRIEDMRRTLGELVEKVKEAKPQYFVFAGDGFKTFKPTPREQGIFREAILNIAAAGIDIFILVGNHDYSEADGHHCFEEFDDWMPLISADVAMGNIQVIEGPHIHPDKDCIFYFIPHVSKAAAEKSGSFEKAYATILTDFSEHFRKNGGGKKGIVFTHVYVSEAKIGANDMVVSTSRQVPAHGFKAFDITFCGDIHKSQRIDPDIYYPGSIERVDFGEQDDIKGFIVYDTEGSVTFINLNVRNMEEIVMDLVNPGFVKSMNGVDTGTAEHAMVDNCLMYIAQALEEKRAQLKDAIVKVKVICTKEQKAQMGDCDEQLGALLLNELKVHSVKSISYEITDKISVRNAEINESLGPVAALNKFLGMQEYKPDTAQQIRIAGEKIIKG